MLNESSWSVITTSRAGAVAVSLFSNSTRYFNGSAPDVNLICPNPWAPTLSFGSSEVTMSTGISRGSQVGLIWRSPIAVDAALRSRIAELLSESADVAGQESTAQPPPHGIGKPARSKHLPSGVS